MSSKKQEAGFTLLEVIVALSLFTIVIIMALSMYMLSAQTHSRMSAKVEMAQNVRVSLSRMSREIRQSPEVVTELSTNKEDSASEIIFQDGHNQEEIGYIEYYLDGTDLRRSEMVYYFPSEEDEYVSYNTRDRNDELPEKKIVEDRLVGEYFEDLNFWRDEEVVNIEMTLELAGDNFKVGSGVYHRN
jgi:prepilin-type N-terminal cleavage/methylation domain-containing protein